jgi:Na+/H+ antiporter NhaD/arsenite permease-like protein
VYHPGVEYLLSASVLLLTLLLILIRPWGLNESWWAAAGGMASVGLGLVSPLQAWLILRETQDAILLLVRIIVVDCLDRLYCGGRSRLPLV